VNKPPANRLWPRPDKIALWGVALAAAAIVVAIATPEIRRVLRLQDSPPNAEATASNSAASASVSTCDVQADRGSKAFCQINGPVTFNEGIAPTGLPSAASNVTAASAVPVSSR
jgi:hypothetical protein